jgi:hypothetical protein
MCYWHSLDKTIIVVESKRLTEAVFKSVCEFVENCKKQRQIRRALYGLMSMLENPTNLPPVPFLITKDMARKN